MFLLCLVVSKVSVVIFKVISSGIDNLKAVNIDKVYHGVHNCKTVLSTTITIQLIHSGDDDGFKLSTEINNIYGISSLLMVVG